MAGLKSLVCLAFLGAIGMTLLILACALHSNWWPFFVLVFYLLAPLPTLLVQRHVERSGGSASTSMDLAIFITMGLIISAFGLPIILTRAPVDGVITATACYLTLSANVVIFATLIGFFMIFEEDDPWWQI